MPTPIATSPACEELVQNGNWEEGPLQVTDIPHWDVTYENLGNWVFYETQNFGGEASGNCFWTKWENDYPPLPTEKVYINLAQSFSRCVGVPYRLSFTYYIHGCYEDGYPNKLPITFQASVGFNGSTPIATRKLMYPISDGSGGCNGGSGDVLILLNPLSMPPAPGTDGVSLTLSDSFGGDMELILYNVSLTAMSN